MLWGKFSDRRGRRPVLLTGLIGNSISACSFGLSKNLWWAIGTRAFCGIVNGSSFFPEDQKDGGGKVHGDEMHADVLCMHTYAHLTCAQLGNGGVARSMLSEITDETNRAKAFSLFGFCWGIGMIGTLFIHHARMVVLYNEQYPEYCGTLTLTLFQTWSS